MSKPSIPKGTRDFLPLQSKRRTFIFNTVQKVFEKYGFEKVETPAMENLSTLTGKYGEEGDRLIFKVQPRGKKLESQLEQIKLGQKTDGILAEEALRYDLTVPFARMVVQHQNHISFPFKRYQIQPVWRADRPQKGRYREFYQCDIDVVGSNSLLNELEMIQITNEVFTNLNVPGVIIKLNNRKILAGIAEFIGEPDKLVDITVAIDKIDKIGIDKVLEELYQKNISEQAIKKLSSFLLLKGTNEQKLADLADLLRGVDIAEKGIFEAKFVLQKALKLGIENITLDISLARGLNYYTGAIFEVVSEHFPSSICGGGRYDDLTSIFGMPNVSGVGISFGADRIYDLMLQLNLFDNVLHSSTQVLFANFGEVEVDYCLALAAELRNYNISTEIYPDKAKLKKQYKYANDKFIPLVLAIGSDEIEKNQFTIKVMETGEQLVATPKDIVSVVKDHLTIT